MNGFYGFLTQQHVMTGMAVKVSSVYGKNYATIATIVVAAIALVVAITSTV